MQGRANNIVDVSKKQRVTVWRCPYNNFYPDISAGPRAVFDHEWLTETFR